MPILLAAGIVIVYFLLKNHLNFFRLHHSHHNLVQQELCTIENKNPFRHVGNVVLGKTYPSIGKKNEPIKPHQFASVILNFVRNALVESGSIPKGFDSIEDVASCIKISRSGLVLELSYMGQRKSLYHVFFKSIFLFNTFS